MKISIIKKIERVFVLLLFVFLYVQNAFADGPGEFSFKKIAVVGDSYAGHFSLNEGTDQFAYYIFPVGTIYNELNEKVFESAISADNRYILFATGVNDQALNTSLSVFEEKLRKYAEEMKVLNKYLFLHTYMNYAKVKNGHGSFAPEDYDSVYKKLAEEYDNVMYIDMSAFNKDRYDFGDGVHYNKFFYDTLCSKLLFYVISLEKSVFKTIGTGTRPENKKQISTAGDIVADEFFGYENRREYVITNFAKAGKSISENKEQIIRAINYDAHNVLISVGINDYEQQTAINTFMDSIRECLNESCQRDKNVFLYTSLDYEKDLKLPLLISQYDTAIEEVANEYPNTCYINLGNYVKDVPRIYDTLYVLLDSMIKVGQ